MKLQHVIHIALLALTGCANAAPTEEPDRHLYCIGSSSKPSATFSANPADAVLTISANSVALEIRNYGGGRSQSALKEQGGFELVTQMVLTGQALDSTPLAASIVLQKYTGDLKVLIAANTESGNRTIYQGKCEAKKSITSVGG